MLLQQEICRNICPQLLFRITCKRLFPTRCEKRSRRCTFLPDCSRTRMSTLKLPHPQSSDGVMRHSGTCSRPQIMTSSSCFCSLTDEYNCCRRRGKCIDASLLSSLSMTATREDESLCHDSAALDDIDSTLSRLCKERALCVFSRCEQEPALNEASLLRRESTRGRLSAFHCFF